MLRAEHNKLPRVALVVEDDEPIRNSLVGLLEDEGFTVYTAATLVRARQLLAKNSIGIMVLDLNLIDGDGEVIVEELHDRGRGSPAVVVLSAFADRAVPLANAYGIPHVTKPFDVSVVVATVLVAHDRAMRPHRVSTATVSGVRRVK